MSFQKWDLTYKTLDSLGISLLMNDFMNEFQAYEKEIRKLDFEGKADSLKVVDEVSNSDTKRYQARKEYVQLHQSLLKHWLKGYYYHFILKLIDFAGLEMIFRQEFIERFMNFERSKELQQELNQWCYQHKDILAKIQKERLEELSYWDDSSDHTFIEDKLFIDKMTEQYTKDNEYI